MSNIGNVNNEYSILAEVPETYSEANTMSVTNLGTKLVKLYLTYKYSRYFIYKKLQTKCKSYQLSLDGSRKETVVWVEGEMFDNLVEWLSETEYRTELTEESIYFEENFYALPRSKFTRVNLWRNLDFVYFRAKETKYRSFSSEELGNYLTELDNRPAMIFLLKNNSLDDFYSKNCFLTGFPLKLISPNQNKNEWTYKFSSLVEFLFQGFQPSPKKAFADNLCPVYFNEILIN